MYLRQLPLWLAQTNCWIISASERETQCILIDAPPQPATIIAELTKWGLSPVAILATHGHVDHVGGIAEISRHSFGKEPRLPNATYIHPNDRYMIQDPIGTSGVLGEELAKLGIDVRPPEVLLDLVGESTIRGAGLSFEVLHTPGHTRGSVCILATSPDASEKVLFSGDHLFKGSIGRTDLPGGSYEELVESMRSKIFPLDDDLTVLPGHGEHTSIGTERTQNPFLLQMQANQ